jgi:hypothetical protein
VVITGSCRQIMQLFMREEALLRPSCLR